MTHLYQQVTFSLISFLFQGDFSPLDVYKTYQRQRIYTADSLGYFQVGVFPQKNANFHFRKYSMQNV